MLVIIDGKRTVELGSEDRLTVGRMDDPDEGVIGLDPLDRAISRKAVRLIQSDAGWVIHNISRSQPAYVENAGGGPLLPLAPGSRHLVDRRTAAVEVRGHILVHRVDLLLEDREGTATEGGSGDLDTLTDDVSITQAERGFLLLSGKEKLEIRTARNLDRVPCYGHTGRPRTQWGEERRAYRKIAS